MIEIAIAVLIVCAAVLYWYARLFPTGWGRLRTAFGAPPPRRVKASGCGGCTACDRAGKGGCH